jgi:hypothetical protein
VLVNRAALDRQILAPERHERGLQPRGAIDDHEFGAFQPAGIKVIEELAPGGRALPAVRREKGPLDRFLIRLTPDGKQNLLTIAAHADRCQNRYVRGFPVKPRPDHGAVKDKADV